MIEIHVNGVPAPQGSKKHVGRGILIESSKQLPTWRAAVNAAYMTATKGLTSYDGPVEVRAVFAMPRPRHHYGTGRNTGILKPRYADMPHITKPDSDKLTRAILDALSTTNTQLGAYKDDSHVVRLEINKRYVRQDEHPNAHIVVKPAKETP